MAWAVNNITLTRKYNSDAIDIVNKVAIAENRSATKTTELLIIKAGEQWAEQIKLEKERQKQVKEN